MFQLVVKLTNLVSFPINHWDMTLNVQTQLQQTHVVLFLSKQQRLTHSHLTSIWYDTISIYQELSVKWVLIVWRALWQCMLKMLTMRTNEDAWSYNVSTWTLVRKGKRSVSGRFGQPALLRSIVETSNWIEVSLWAYEVSRFWLSVREPDAEVRLLPRGSFRPCSKPYGGLIWDDCIYWGWSVPEPHFLTVGVFHFHLNIQFPSYYIFKCLIGSETSTAF